MRASLLSQNALSSTVSADHAVVAPEGKVRLAVMAAVSAMPPGQPLMDHRIPLAIRLALHLYPACAVAPATSVPNLQKHPVVIAQSYISPVERGLNERGAKILFTVPKPIWQEAANG